MNYLKKCFKSWTIWLNSTGIVLLTVAMSEPTLLDWLNAHNFTHIIVIANLLLRFKTSSAIGDK